MYRAFEEKMRRLWVMTAQSRRRHFFVRSVGSTPWSGEF
jgi:hypothetical protein